MKIGILGGSFNPIHLGHIKIAEDVKASLGLDEIWFVCAGQPSHKKDVISCVHRYNMVVLSLKNHPSFFPSDIEIRHKLFFSIDTLKYLESNYGKNNEFYFLVGFDAFLEINTWRDWQRLFEITHFAIFNRYPVNGDIRPILERYFPGYIRPGVDNKEYRYRGKKIRHINVKSFNISGSEIRDMVRKKIDIMALVDREVADYIEANNLYA
jgi:nicotinate-nucleotide adenylyltransferase